MNANPKKAALLQDRESDPPGGFLNDAIFDASDLFESDVIVNTVDPRIVLAAVRRPDVLLRSFRVAIDSS